MTDRGPGAGRTTVFFLPGKYGKIQMNRISQGKTDPAGPRGGNRRGREPGIGQGVKMMDYTVLTEQAKGLLESEPWYVAAFSNISSLIMAMMPDLNWAGFYLMRNGTLTVGPFQGKPACIHIAPGKGVCGTAAARDETVVVPDVHLFPGHIACDGASESEIVIPIRAEGRVAAVLDIDSPVKGRFGPEEQAGLEALTRTIEERVLWG